MADDDRNASSARASGQQQQAPAGASSVPQAVDGGPAPQAADWSAQISQAIQDGNSQTMFLRQQVGQLFNAVNQLYGAVSAQCVQLRDSDAAVVQELQKFQSGGPQRAMAGVYAKLFRDLLKHMNELDELVALAENDKKAAAESSWLMALRVQRDHFEAILREWGCAPVEIRIGQEEFDPEIHEAVADSEPKRAGRNSNKVTGVRRRGWTFSGSLLQYPQVLVD